MPFFGAVCLEEASKCEIVLVTALSSHARRAFHRSASICEGILRHNSHCVLLLSCAFGSCSSDQFVRDTGLRDAGIFFAVSSTTQTLLRDR